jgi:hypothetical protein
MKPSLQSRMSMFLAGICVLCTLILFTACAGVTTSGIFSTNGTASITGIVASVDTQNHRVTLNINGQQIIVTGLTDAQLTTFRTQQGRQFTVQVRQIGISTYDIDTGTDPIENDNGTPGIVMTTSPFIQNEPGTTEFTGKVQSVHKSSIVVTMPDGQVLPMNRVSDQTDLDDFHGMLPSMDQMVNVRATTNTDGSFMASKLSVANNDDLQKQNIVVYHGVTTSAVGPDGKLNLQVGKRRYSFLIGTEADLKDFSHNAQSIGSNTPVKANVLFSGSTGTVMSLDHDNSSH